MRLRYLINWAVIGMPGSDRRQENITNSAPLAPIGTSTSQTVGTTWQSCDFRKLSVREKLID
ncbi:hypothetical protein CY34DRAFT_797475 [Suillus luteus UH-Slu-Lm8-n1]|uniref:Uncharacterized protein n=1 Tax=Suillus luteus UH-Slu-Lm8-n1 TaxID=930992 RepID=A0A0D0AFY5_9AGAM|nr:hypothetical protein CY34DRAFT_797475 [Suillus luteus UH-Slu-Lm8-n1]